MLATRKASITALAIILLALASIIVIGEYVLPDNSISGAAIVGTPTVVSTSPANNALDVLVNTNMAVTFSEAMEYNSVVLAFSATPSVGAYSVTYTSDSKTFIFDPASDLAPGTKYTITIKTTAKSKTGNNLAAPYIWSFITKPAPCNTPVATFTVTPAEATAQVGANLKYTVTIKNNDNGASCLPTTYGLGLSEPCSDPWSCSLDKNSLILSPGQSGSATLTISSSEELSGSIYVYASRNSGQSGPNPNSVPAKATFTSAATCSVTLDLQPNPVQVSKDVTATATVTGGAGCGRVSICTPYVTDTRTPDSNGKVSIVYTAPSSSGSYSFTAALVDKGATCTTPEPSDLADTKILTVTTQPACQTCGLGNPIVEPETPLPNTEFNVDCQTLACNTSLTCPNLGAYIDDRSTGSCSFISWIATGAKFSCSGKSAGPHTAYCIGETSSLKCSSGLPECAETSQKSFNISAIATCTGKLNLTFNPTSTATKNHKVTANVSGFSNCDGNNVVFSCEPSLTIPSCKYSSSVGCTSTFTAPSKTGAYYCSATVADYRVGQALNVIECNRQNPILTIEPALQYGAKGDSLLYTAKINNNNTCDTTFNLSANCYSNSWTCDLYDENGEKVSVLDLDIAEGDSANTSLVITPPNSAAIGSYVHTATAADASHSEFTSTASAEYDVATCSRQNPTLTVTNAKQNGKPGEEHIYTIKITNSDKCSSYYALNLSCATGWSCKLSTDYIYLLNSKSGSFTAKLMPGASTAIGSYNFTFSTYNWYDNNKTASATLTYNVTTASAVNQSIIDQTLAYFKVGDGNCDAALGENTTNSPSDCAPPAEDTPAVCGNNVAEAGEDCDGSSDARCSSLCNADCTCPFIIGDSVCDSSARESASISIDCQKKSSSMGLIIVLLGIIGALGGAGFYYMKRKGMLGGLLAAHGVETATPGVDLGTAVNSMLSEGYKPEEIHSSLESGGWPHSKVDSAMGSAQADQEALGKLAERQGVAAPTEKAKASKYVKKCLEEGYDPTQIRTALRSGGWPAGAVDDIISKQTAKHIQSHAAKAGVGKPSGGIGKLKKYVKKELNEGHTKSSIEKVLKDSGWPDSDIDEAFGS